MKLTLFRFYIAFCGIFAFQGGLFAQVPAKFPDNSNEFVDKLGEFMTASKRPDMEESYSVFKKIARSGAFSEADMKRVIGISNLLAEQRLSAFPYYKNYINAVSAARSNSDTTLFTNWHGFAESVLTGIEKGKTKSIGQFLEFSADFMEQRALKTGEGGSVTWKVKGGKFDFLYKDNIPRLICTDVDLIGVRKKDSITVKTTSGEYFPYEGVWKGKGGQVDWKDAGLDSSVFVVLSNYKVESVKPLFVCDTAQMYYPLFFPGKAIAGRFEHSIVVDNKAGSQFPRFESFDKSLQINKIGEGVEYKGGFLLRGSSLFGYGTTNEPACMTVYNKNRKKIFFGTGPLFIMKREVSIVGEGIDARLYMEEDSLFHPAARFRMDIPKQVISLERGEKGSEKNPFFSSFYNMNLNTDRVAWHLNQDSLEIGARAGVKGLEQTVSFESSNNFNQADYDRMQSTGSQNPIATLFLVYREKGTNIISDNDFAQAIDKKFDYSSIQTLLAQMVAEGYINYYFDRHQIEIRDKLKHYALASQGKKDFDAINIKSVSSTANARLNLKTKETEIFEVNKIELSKRQRVAVIPEKRELTLLQNRDMRFEGRLYAGFTLFQGRDMKFTYDKFQVEFDSVKHLDFYLPTGEIDPKTREPQASAMNSNVELLSGVLLVDAPNNKSGKEEMALFPSLQSKKHSFVFYDRPDIKGGAYKRDSFYFKLDPFSFDGLDSYTKERLRFKGEMTPATVFPPFKETIIVREDDKSFGFIHRTPQTGYGMYTNKGKYTGEVDLSNKGFVGKGKMEYLTADIESEDLVFKPKQTTGTAKKFFMEEDRDGAVKVPQAKGENVSVNWLPFKDSMYVESKAKAFELFKQSGYTHKGALVLTPTGLKGRGEFEWAEGKLTSKQIVYNPFQASSDTANLEIKSLDTKGIALDSRNVDGELDFDTQKGAFKANSESATTTLPLDQYRTSMNEFNWDMKAKTIEFKSDPKRPGSFVSIDPNQDSLRFQGKTALYDMNTNLLKIGGVQVIKSADAFIYVPDTSDVYIQPGGKMKELVNVRILADTVTKYHAINRAKVTILGKKLYKASGYYEYNIPGFEQEVFFKDIVGERRGEGNMATKNVLTTAEGEIKFEDSFHMDIKTLFKGKIILKANQPNMRFEGFSMIVADKLHKTQWFSMYSEVDKNDPTIKIKKADNEDDDPMVTGFYLSREQGDMYPRILLPPYARVDRAILNCQDVYKYDAKTDRFTFGDSSRVAGKAIYGSKMVFDNRTGVVQGEGPLNLGSGLAYMKIKGAGRLKSDYSTVTDSTGFDVSGEFMTGMEMIIPKQLMEMMANDLKASSFDAGAALYSSNATFYQSSLREFVTDSADWKEVSENLQTNFVKLPKKDNKFAFLLGRHPTIWNAEYQSFLSLEDKIPVIEVGGEPIGKMLNAYVEYKMPGNGDDRFYLYIKPSPDLWYFFGYQAGALNVVSSSTKFNDALLSMKAKDTQIKMPDGELYEIVAANPSLADAFVNRVRSGRKK